MKKIRLVATALLACVAISGTAFASVPHVFAHEGDNPASESQLSARNTLMPSIPIKNGEFGTGTDSDYKLETPSEWTGESVADPGVKHGVVDTGSLSNYQQDETGFSRDDIVAMTDVKHRNEDDDKNKSYKALLINNTVQSAYRYSSGEFTIPANSFFAISISVYTGENNPAALFFSAEELKDLHAEVITNNRWRQHTFFIRSPQTHAITTKLCLGIGRITKDGHVNSSMGYAFFDSVSTALLTPDRFANILKDHMITDPDNDSDIDKENEKEKRFPHINNSHFMLAKINSGTGKRLPFGTLTADSEGWKIKTVGSAEIINAQDTSALTDDKYKIDGTALVDPTAPFPETDSKVLTFFSNANDSVEVVSGKDNNIVIPRFGYGRLSVWVNQKNTKSGSVNIKLASTDNDRYPEESSSISSVNAQNDKSWTEGWGEAVFLIKGSSIADRAFSLSLSVSSLKGAISFNSVSFSPISAEDYTKFSDGTKFELAATTDTLPGGSFTAYDAPAKDDILPAAKNWTVSKDKNTVTGIAPLGEYFYSDEYEATRNKIDGAFPPKQSFDGKNTALLIWHPADSYTTYESEKFKPTAVEGSPYNLIKVQLAAYLPDNQGATLELFAGDDKISEIPNINTASNANFANLTFCVKPASDTEYKLKLSVGSSSKPVKGAVWVNNVWTGVSKEQDPTAQRFVSIDDERFGLVYGNSAYYENYAWETVRIKNADAGLMTFVKTNQESLAAYSDSLNAMISDDMHNSYGLYIHAGQDLTAGLKRKTAYSFAKDTFTKVTVRLKTRGFGTGQGARITLGDTEIREINTELIREDEVNAFSGTSLFEKGRFTGFRDYTFYVKAGDADQTASFAAFIGNGAKKGQLRAGSLLIDTITLSAITEAEYEEDTKVFETYEDTEKNAVNLPTFIRRAVLGASKPTDDVGHVPNLIANGEDLYPWLIPSLLFGVALLITFAGVGIRKFKRRPKATATVKARGLVTYDRNNKIILPTPRNTAAAEKKQVSEEPEELVEIDYNAPLVHADFETADKPVSVDEESAASTEPLPEEAAPELPKVTADSEGKVIGIAPVAKPTAVRATHKPAKKNPLEGFDKFDD